MKVLCFLLGIACLILLSEGRKRAQCLVACKKAPDNCPLYKCLDGMVLKEDPCGCECPKCACRKTCHYNLNKICQGCKGGYTIEDPCGCKCPKCVCHKKN